MNLATKIFCALSYSDEQNWFMNRRIYVRYDRPEFSNDERANAIDLRNCTGRNGAGCFILHFEDMQRTTIR